MLKLVEHIPLYHILTLSFVEIGVEHALWHKPVLF